MRRRPQLDFRRTVAAAALVLCGGAGPTDFGAHWHDGRAELDGYRYSVTRYGRTREGQAVMIFVTEPFSAAKRVKPDDPARDPADTVEVLKLNLVRDFQTGIYDYNTMTSVFAETGAFAPLKISFSSAEWCGHVYEELIPDVGVVRHSLQSYFEGETAAGTLPAREGGLTEDSLYVVLRGLRGPFLEPGASVEVPFLPGAFHRRLNHRPIGWTTARIERAAAAEHVEVPAGSFSTIAYSVTTAEGRLGRFSIEEAYPHRIVRWSWGADRPVLRPPDGSETGELTGTLRVSYWQLHENGDERYLKELGLDGQAP